MPKNEDIKIDKMVLNIDGEKVNLTIEQAKKLKKLLDDLFGKEVIKEVHTDHHYLDWFRKPYYYTPVPSWDNQIVYCADSTITCKV